MTTIPCNIGPFACPSPTGGVSFRPTRGSIAIHGDRRRITRRAGEVTHSGLIIVGLPTLEERAPAPYDRSDVVDLVRTTRCLQTGTLRTTFITQAGLLRRRAKGAPIEEPAVRIFILRRSADRQAAFEQDVIAVAQALADRLRRGEVVVEFQDNGLSKHALGITPDT